MARKLVTVVPPPPAEFIPPPRKTPAQLERAGMWYDAQKEREYRAHGQDGAHWFPQNDAREDSSAGDAASGFPGVLGRVRSSVGVRSIGQMMSEGCSLNTGRPHRGPGRGLKV